jgi:uncharacterized membrane protein
LRFPEDNEPDYWDFIYFAFVIGMTFQVSDVQARKNRSAVWSWPTVCCHFSSSPPWWH